MFLCIIRELYKLYDAEGSEENEYYCSNELSCSLKTVVHSATCEEDQDFRYHFRNAFQECVDHHRFIVECLNKMEKFYSPIWFLKTGQVIFLMCLVAFVSVKVGSNRFFF